MTYQVKFEPKAKKQLAKIPKKSREKILSALPFIANNPFSGKKLSGKLEGVYSYRVWSYRIIYKIYKTKLNILIIRIGPRQGAHK